jgi:outer membrane receptor for ferrienterochelin and colicins
VRRDLEMYGLWKFDPRNQLRVAVSNILGQDYISQNTYSDAFGSVHRTSIFPGTVVVRATMEMKF